MYINKAIRTSFGILAAVGVVGAAHAVPAYNQNLIDAPGVYFGDGNVNGGWAVDTEDGIELGLRAKFRQGAVSLSDSNGLYGLFPAGTQTTPAPNPNRATWNFEFSINVRADGDASRTIGSSGLTFQLCADTDRTSGFVFECVNVITTDPFDTDNAFKGPDRANSWAQQNSGQLLFADWPGHTGYDINAAGLYSFQLTAFDSAGAIVAQTAITAAVVPEPATVGLLGLGLLGLGFSRRRKL